MIRREQIVSLVRGSLTLDTITARAYINGKDLLLTPKEFSLLFILVQNEGKLIMQEALYMSVWKQPMTGDNQAVKSAISRLRKKIEGSGYDVYSHRGMGYSFTKK